MYKPGSHSPLHIVVLTDWEAAWWATILLSKGLYLAHEHCHPVVSPNRATSLQFSLNDVEPDHLDQGEVIVTRAMNDRQLALPETEWLAELLVKLVTQRQVQLECTTRFQRIRLNHHLYLLIPWFVAYLMTLSVAQTAQCRMVGRWASNELKRMLKYVIEV